MMNLIRLLAILLLCTIFCPLYAEDSQTKRTIHVAQAGTLPNLISESEKYNIEELTLTGELNGTDFRLLRDMAGCNYLGENTSGKLKVVDMSDAKVVKGGDACVSTNNLAGWSGRFFSKIEEDNSFPQCIFMGCNMSSVKMPKTITSIGNWAFYGNSRLTSIDIPNNVRSIGTRTFQNCSGIRSISIPNSVASIAENAFNGCSGILSLRVEGGNTTYDSRNDCNAIIETSTNTLILGCQNTTMPNDLQGIGSFAFYRKSTPVSIVLPKTMMSIGEYAFGYCTNLKSIDLPDGMTQIGYYAFEGCSSLESVEIPNSLTSLGFAAFRFCSSITSISIPKSLHSISDCAFEKCSKLNMVTMQNSVNSIGYNAFHGCSSLTSITIPRSVKKIGEKAFADCSSLTSIISKIVNPFEIQDVFSADTYNKAILTVPAGKKTSYQAINEWNKFTQIIEGEQEEEVTTKMTIHVATAGTLPELIPSDVRNDLEELTLTGELNGTDFRLLRELGGCDYLGNETSGQLRVLDFSDARVVKGGERYVDTDHLPGFGGNFRYTVEKDDIIPAHIFHGCKFKSVDISNSATSIENYAFNRCNNLTFVTVPNSVTKIGGYVFESCVSLISIAIPKSVTSIGNEAFRYCNSLSSITIPNSVTNIGSNIILDCEILSTVIVESGNVKYDSRNDCNAIIETASNTLIAGCRNSTIPNSVTSIGNSAFSICRNLTSITIPNSVTTIGDWAFNFCDKLTSLTIPNSVVFIGSSAFRCCNSLTSIIIPSSVQTIKSDSFVQCENIKSIIVESDNTYYDSRNNCNAIIETASNTLIKGCETTIIPNGVTSIGQRAFEECKGLTNITIPNSVQHIGKRAFSYTNLSNITLPYSLSSIGDEVFYGCSLLKIVTSKIRNPFKINKDVFKLYEGSWGGYDLMIPYGTKSRYEATEGWDVFSKITEEELADGVVFVGKIAGDKELDFLIISNNGKTCQVGDGIVCATINLTEEKIVIPNVVNGYSVKAIGSNAFQNCSTLKSTTIPNTVTSIGDGAFAGCSGLTSIILRIENPFAINEKVFPQEAYSATLYVPLGTREKYLATAGWKKFKEIVEIATKNGVVFTDDVDGVTVSFKVTDVDNLKCQFGSGEESAISQSVTSFSVPSEAKGLTVASIADNAIANCSSLLSVTFPETIETVGSNVLLGCTNLAVIKWNAERAVPDALTSGVNNPNLLLYVKDKSYAPAAVKNVVANGTADEIVLKETDGGNNFYCPEAFTAKRISFVHNYSMESGYKECRGWETIVLPFDVTSIMSETGSYVVPRSAWTNEDSQHKPFFLYEWTTAGWQPATAIKANIPYIICMPNNENYDPIYQLKGDFEFTGTNVQVFSTDEIGTVVYRNKRFVPNYLNKEASQSMLPLNVNNLWDKNTKADYTEGSAFLRGLRAVRPFEAYMMMEEGMAAPMAIPVFGDGTPTGIGATLVNSERVNSESWYSLDGRKLQGKPTSKGVYILNGRKVVVK